MKIPGLGAAKRVADALVWQPIVPNKRRGRMLQALGYPEAARAYWGPRTVVVKPDALTVGPGSFINDGCYIDAGRVSLGANVFLGPRTMLITGNHGIGPATRRAADGEHSFITIGDGSWLGAGVIVLPGVSIAPGCVIGAGAVVTKDCDANGLYAGVPARRVKDLPA